MSDKRLYQVDFDVTLDGDRIAQLHVLVGEDNDTVSIDVISPQTIPQVLEMCLTLLLFTLTDEPVVKKCLLENILGHGMSPDTRHRFDKPKNDNLN